MQGFRVFCMVVAMLSCACFEFTSRYLTKYQHLTVPVPTEIEPMAMLKKLDLEQHKGKTQESQLHALTYAKQLSSHKNFLVIVCMTAIQQFDCTFGKNFFTLFLAQMVSCVWHTSPLNPACATCES
jgi:hypothetical protein